MSVHVSPCTNYDFNALTPVVWKLWRYVSSQKWVIGFFEHCVSIKFCTKLGKSASDTYAILSKAHGGRSCEKNQVFLTCINGWMLAHMSKSQMKTTIITFFSIKGTVHFGSTKLITCKYWSGYMKLWVEEGLNFGPTLGFSTWQCCSSESIVYQAVSGPPYSPDLAPNYICLFPKTKSALKGWRVQNTEDKKNVTSLKAIPHQ
jgi:hypothetical protein